MLLALGAAVTLSVAVGAGALTTSGVLQARTDRTVVGLVVGAALGLAGATLQGSSRNPLADPGLLGLTAGAVLTVVVATAVLGIGSSSLVGVLAVVGVLVVGVLVHLATRRVPVARRPETSVLVGAALTAVCSSAATGILLTDRGALDQLRSWQVGSSAGRSVGVLLPVALLLLGGVVLALALAPGLDALALGDEAASALGHDVGRLHGLALLAAALLTAGATAVAGPFGFVGFLAPHAARPLVGTGHLAVLPASAGCGSAFVVIADVVGRVLAPPGEVPAGITVALVGAPALVLLLRRRTLA